MNDTTIEKQDARPVQHSPSKETVEVKKDDLTQLIKRLDKLEDENRKLIEVADKGRLAHWESTHKGKVPRSYYLSTYNGKIVMQWKLTQNRVWKDPKTGMWQELQEIGITLEDGEKVMIPYVEFVSNTQRQPASLVSTEQKGHVTYLTLELPGDKKITIDSTYVN